jgi:abortive infection bacteriophage resistance protein
MSLINFLRISLFESISDIEVSIKALLNNTLACKYGAHWIFEPRIFKPEFQVHHQALVVDITEYCKNNPEEHFIKRYRMKFDDPDLPPSWMVIEILSLGTTSWLHCLTYIRNLCAHQAKVLDRTLTIRPVMPSRKKNRFLNDVEELDVSKIYSVLCCIQFLLQVVNPKSDFKNNIVNLLAANPQVDPTILGFTKNWSKEGIWQ